MLVPKFNKNNKTKENKIIKITVLDKERIKESLSVLWDSFFIYENICIGK